MKEAKLMWPKNHRRLLSHRKFFSAVYAIIDVSVDTYERTHLNAQGVSLPVKWPFAPSIGRIDFPISAVLDKWYAAICIENTLWSIRGDLFSKRLTDARTRVPFDNNMFPSRSTLMYKRGFSKLHQKTGQQEKLRRKIRFTKTLTRPTRSKLIFRAPLSARLHNFKAGFRSVPIG